METSTKHLSSLKNSTIQTNDAAFSLKQYKRTYPGNFSVNFVNCLSAINGADTKNYTNFYLTNTNKISDVFEQDTSRTRVPHIFGPISYGGKYLKFSEIDPRPYAALRRFGEHKNYGAGVFSSTQDSKTNFTIDILENNRCRIFFTLNYKKFYLCSDIDLKLIFVKDQLLTFNEDVVEPQDFDYIFSEDQNFIFFYKRTPSGDYSVTNFNDSLILSPVIANDLISNTSTPFKIFKSIYNDAQVIPDVSFITYEGDNTINGDKSKFNLVNNLLLHKTYGSEDSFTNTIVLKNQLLQYDIFSSANNLLSGENAGIYVDNLREYSTILSDIPEENSESLELNYVFYNKPYIIKPGSNLFYSPSSMYPFAQLNINDTKFIDSGAFSYITPQYSDKVYHISTDYNNKVHDQHLLCTWLSGAPNSDEKIWVDRYYYPDLIEKQAALSAVSESYDTYDDQIENLILLNTNVLSSCQFKKFFDKKSDLVFIPNNSYNYSRIDASTFSNLSSIVRNIALDDINYFRDINENGEMTIGFTFDGDDSSWVVKSDRNEIDSGLTITKSGQTLTITYDVYDSTMFEYDLTEFSWIRNTKTVDIQPYKPNFICIGVNTKNKESYFFVNNQIVATFKLPTYQLYIKHLVYGDFFVFSGDTKTKLLNTSSSNIYNVFVSNQFAPSELASVLLLLNKATIVDDITISLPCGMRNSTDSIGLLNSVCGVSTFKSTYININVKNTNIEQETILNDLSQHLRDNIEDSLPANITINNIEFNDYKQ